MGWMTCIGDLHGRTPKVRSDSYLVLLAGDICPDLSGSTSQAEWMNTDLRAWLKSLPCPCVAVPGNHDRAIAKGKHPRDLPWILMTECQTVKVAGRTIFGMPWVLDGNENGFGASDDFIYSEMEEKFQFGTDIVLSHNPPLGVLDKSTIHAGSFSLRYWIWERKPKLSLFGHCHESRGHKKVGETYFVNVSLGAGCDRTGRPIQAPHPPWGLSDNSWLMCEKKLGNRVLLQMATGDHLQLLDVTAKHHEAYTARHGMKYVALRETPLPDLPASWGKLQAVLDHFEAGADTVVWMDADAVVADMSQDISQACDSGIGMAWYNQPFPHFQAGVFVAHRSERVLTLLRDVIATAKQNPNDPPGDKYGPWEQHPMNEMGIRRGLITTIERKWNCVPAYAECSTPIVMAAHGYRFAERLEMMRRFVG